MPNNHLFFDTIAHASILRAKRLILHVHFVVTKIWPIFLMLLAGNLSYAKEINLQKPLPPQLAIMAKNAGLNVPLVLALVEVGSGFDAEYVGADGRLGLFALDATLMRRYYRLPAKQLFDPERAAPAALKYLLDIERRYASTAGNNEPQIASHYLSMRPVDIATSRYQPLEHEQWLDTSPEQLHRVKLAYQRWKKVYVPPVSPNTTRVSQPQKLMLALPAERTGCPRVLDDFMVPNSPLYHGAGRSDFNNRAVSRDEPHAEQVLDEWSPCW